MPLITTTSVLRPARSFLTELHARHVGRDSSRRASGASIGLGGMNPALLFLAMAMLVGCTSAVESGHNTFLNGDDLIKMTDQMAASIAGSPEVNAAVQEQGKLRVVVEPVRNEMEAAVLPPGQADAFTSRVRYLLSTHAPDRFMWIMNRDAYYRLRERELSDVPLGPAPDAVSPRYGLVARFRSLAHESSQARSDAYLCVFELTDLQTRTILWTDKYEVKKSATKGFLD